MSAVTTPVTTLLCDADGTLFPSEEPAFDASVLVTNALLGKVGVRERLTAEQLRLTTTGKNFRTTAVDLLVAHGVPVEAALVGERAGAVTTPRDGWIFSAEDLDEWVREEAAVVTGHLGQVLRPDPAVTNPLAALSSRFRLAAVSSSATARLKACFRATGLGGLIPPEVRFSAEDSLPAPRSKPDPAVYTFACERLGVPPAECRAVEDSVPGARSAVLAGVPTVGLLQFVPPAERASRRGDLLAAGVETVLESWAGVEQLLRSERWAVGA
ncbi:MAG TPA: HAD family phosphatase [Sporichthya sp.]|nr:HAD family phosphatase [Sporichthya sp.]